MEFFLPEYPDHYYKALDVFHDKCEGPEYERAWAKKVLGSKILDTFPADKNMRIRILSVGCGDGFKDAGLLEALTDRQVEYTAVDPANDMLQSFNELVAADPRFSNVKFNLVQTTCEEFLKEKSTEKFDIIHFVHSFYLIEDLDGIISGYQKMLSADGFMLILISANDSVQQIERYNLGMRKMDIGQTLQRLQLDFMKEQLIWTVDISSMVDAWKNGLQNNNLEDGDYLIDFIAYKYRFTENFPQKKVQSFFDNILSSAKMKGDKLLLDCTNDAFFIKAS